MSTPRRVTDWRALTLTAGGRSLIEASAGTGKTWTIAVLYLRLLLERELSPRQIVVATFTDAAAQELRERIRARLGWALALCGDGSGGTADDPAAAWLRARGGPAQQARDVVRLRLALAELDLAPIGTLHGLCSRILREFPLASGSPLQFGELVDGKDLREQLLDDLWRQLAQTTATQSAQERIAWELGRNRLGKYLRAALAPGVAIAPADAKALAWLHASGSADELREQVEQAAFLRSNTRLRTCLLKVAEFIAAGAADAATAAGLAKELEAGLRQSPEQQFKPAAIAAGEHLPVREAARRALAALEAGSDAPLREALAHYQQALRARAAARLAAAGELTHDALITRVHAALTGGDDRLGGQLHVAWPVALVDEFQDTDAQQYAILDRIHRGSDGVPRGRLIMIGDPKQAIYGFRGGDVDAYLRARDSAEERLTLDVNYRSAPAYVAALNEWHAVAGRVLSSDPAHAIACSDVAADPQRQDRYTIGGKRCARPLQIHYLAPAPESQPERRALALQACANHIVELLDGAHALDGARLQPRNLAVLLPAHHDIADLRELLQARQVPCVAVSTASVFASEWARELRIVLHAALHPDDDGAVRAALASRLGGHDWQRLRELAADVDGWQRTVRPWHELGELWRRRGVLALVQALIAQATALLRGRGDLERVLTDLRHMGELLQEQSARSTGPGELLAWFGDQCRDGAGAVVGEERQLRIESDAARVSLLTLHASKGLEFDLVLLPLMWANQGRREEVFVVHAADSGQRTLAFGGAARRQQEQEAQDERHRLLYVALTRARHACHVYALPPDRPASKGGKTALSDPQRAPLDALLERLLGEGRQAGMRHVLWSTAGWPWPEARWTGAFGATAGGEARREPPVAPGEYRYSFSALTRATPALPADEAAAGDERDGQDDATIMVSPEAAATALPCPALEALRPVAGTAFGNAVHAVLESRRLDLPLTRQHELVERALRDARVRIDAAAPGLTLAQFVPRLAQRLQDALEAPLPVGSRPLALADLPAHAQRAEMEFDFVLDAVSLRELRAACPWLPATALHELRGLMNGKIDLVFEHEGRYHVVDYKTNRLGDGADLAPYLPARLDAAMDAHHYRFQALLYTIAVERYLRQRVPGYRRERHLGETLYLFVRALGIAPAEPLAGIRVQRFDDALLDAVDRVLGGRVAVQGVA